MNRRSDAGLYMLAAIALLFIALTFWILIRAVWQSPEIRDVPPTATRAPLTVQPTTFVFPSMVPAPPPTARDYLPMRPTSTRIPTATVVPATMTPTPNTTPPVQRGALEST